MFILMHTFRYVCMPELFPSNWYASLNYSVCKSRGIKFSNKSQGREHGKFVRECYFQIAVYFLNRN